MTDNQHTIEGAEPKYYARIPNMAVDDLNYAELALYVHYKRIASDKGKCWQSTATVAKQLGMGGKKVRTTRASLAKRGLIQVTPRMKDGKECGTKTIRIIDVWVENIERFDTPPCPNGHTPLSILTPEEEPIRKTIEEKDSPAEKTADGNTPITSTKTNHDKCPHNFEDYGQGLTCLYCGVFASGTDDSQPPTDDECEHVLTDWYGHQFRCMGCGEVLDTDYTRTSLPDDSPPQKLTMVECKVCGKHTPARILIGNGVSAFTCTKCGNTDTYTPDDSQPICDCDRTFAGVVNGCEKCNPCGAVMLSESTPAKPQPPDDSQPAKTLFVDCSVCSTPGDHSTWRKYELIDDGESGMRCLACGHVVPPRESDDSHHDTYCLLCSSELADCKCEKPMVMCLQCGNVTDGCACDVASSQQSELECFTCETAMPHTMQSGVMVCNGCGNANLQWCSEQQRDVANSQQLEPRCSNCDWILAGYKHCPTCEPLEFANEPSPDTQPDCDCYRDGKPFDTEWRWTLAQYDGMCPKCYVWNYQGNNPGKLPPNFEAERDTQVATKSKPEQSVIDVAVQPEWWTKAHAAILKRCSAIGYYVPSDHAIAGSVARCKQLLDNGYLAAKPKRANAYMLTDNGHAMLQSKSVMDLEAQSEATVKQAAERKTRADNQKAKAKPKAGKPKKKRHFDISQQHPYHVEQYRVICKRFTLKDYECNTNAVKIALGYDNPDDILIVYDYCDAQEWAVKAGGVTINNINICAKDGKPERLEIARRWKKAQTTATKAHFVPVSTKFNDCGNGD